MKIVVLTCYNPSLINFRLDMMIAFREKGHQVTVIGNEAASLWGPKLAPYGIGYREIRMRRNGLSFFGDLRSFLELRKALREESPDKIFSAQAKMVIYGAFAAASLGIREVYPLIAGMGSVFLGNSLKLRLVRLVMLTEYKYALRCSAKVFFQNRDDSSYFIGRRMLSEERIVYLCGSGVNLEKFPEKPLPEKFAFLCVARLLRDKGILEYLEACRIVKQTFPEVRCLLVGPFDSNPSAIRPGELQPYLDDGTVEYMGEQSDVRPYLEACTVFVLPSYREGTPKSVLEAMASARAVITTDAPGCRETVENGLNGLLVPVKDTERLAAAMLRLRQDPELCRTMGLAGRGIAERKFDVRKVNAAILQGMGLAE